MKFVSLSRVYSTLCFSFAKVLLLAWILSRILADNSIAFIVSRVSKKTFRDSFLAWILSRILADNSIAFPYHLSQKTFRDSSLSWILSRILADNSLAFPFHLSQRLPESPFSLGSYQASPLIIRSPSSFHKSQRLPEIPFSFGSYQASSLIIRLLFHFTCLKDFPRFLSRLDLIKHPR
jgi:hypothetical protein